MSSSKPQPSSSSRPHSAASSTRSGKASTAAGSTRGRFFRPVPYSTTLALQQLMDGGSHTSHVTRPTPMQRGSLSSASGRTSSKYHLYNPKPSPASTRRDQVQSDVGKGHSLPVVDEQGQVWLDWEEKQEYMGLMEDHHAKEQGDESGWVDFPSPDGANGGGAGANGRESDDESISKNRQDDLTSRQLLEAFTFGGPSSSSSSNPRRHHAEELVAPDQPVTMTRPRGSARIRRVRTSESLRAGSAPIVIPPIPSAHHPIHTRNESGSDAMQEFVDSSFRPPSFGGAGTDGSKEEHRFTKRASISLKGFAKKLIGKK